MTKEQHLEALNCLKEVNNLKIESTIVSREENLVRINYKHQVVDLGKYYLILSGTLEQFRTTGYSRDRIFLVISLLDLNNEDLKFKPKQMQEFKNVLKDKIFA
jgi:hypothetical protein|tara:strand:+ start:6425 stop:6733 length:309 start_codon:yes stop_codon:yes gene_type:complete